MTKLLSNLLSLLGIYIRKIAHPIFSFTLVSLSFQFLFFHSTIALCLPLKINSDPTAIDTSKVDAKILKPKNSRSVILDSLYLELEGVGSKKDTSKVNLYKDLGWALRFSNLDEAHLFSKKALDLAIKIGYKKGISWSYNNLGEIYWRMGQIDSAIANHTKSMNVSKSQGNLNGVAGSLNNLGIVYKNLGSFDKALESYLKASTIYEKHIALNKRGSANCMNNIGEVYRLKAAYDKALPYYFQALNKFEDLQFNLGIATCNNNIGLTYYSQGQYEKVTQHYQIALLLYQRENNQIGIASTLGNIAINFQTKAKNHENKDSATIDFQNSLEFALKSLDMFGKLKMLSGVARSLNNIGETYNQMGQHKQAIIYIDSSLKISTAIDDKYMIMSDSYNLSIAYASMKQFKPAYENHLQYTNFRDSIFNEDKEKEIGKLEAKYEIEKQLIEQKAQNAKIKKEEDNLIKRRNNLQYLGIGIGLILLFVGVFMLSNFSLPNYFVELSIFIPFLLLFEFVLVFLDPYVDQVTGEEPLYKLLTNAILAGIIFPFHLFFENKLKRKVLLKSEKGMHNESGSGTNEPSNKTLLLILFLSCNVILSSFNFIGEKQESTRTNSSPQNKISKHIVDSIQSLGWELRTSDPKLALQHSRKALKYAQEISYTKGICRTYNNLGEIKQIMGDYFLALRYYKKAAQLSIQLGKEKYEAGSYNNIGNVYYHQGDFAKAIEYYLKALKIEEKLGNQSAIAGGLGNLGNVYYYQQNFEKANEYFSKALTLSVAISDSNGIALSLGNMANIYFEFKDLEKSIKCYKDALKIHSAKGNKMGYANNLGNLAGVLNVQAERSTNIDSMKLIYQRSIQYSKEAVRISKMLDIKYTTSMFLNNIGYTYLKLERFEAALPYLTESYLTAKQLGDMYPIMLAAENLSEANARLNKYEAAYNFHVQFSLYKDSIFNQEKSQEIGRLEGRYEIENRLIQEKLDEEHKAHIQLEEKNRRANLQYSAIGIALILMFALVFFLGRFKFPSWAFELIMFIPFLLLFEFGLVFLDPIILAWTSGEPLYTLLINAALAALIFPIHSLLEKILMKRILLK